MKSFLCSQWWKNPPNDNIFHFNASYVNVTEWCGITIDDLSCFNSLAPARWGNNLKVWYSNSVCRLIFWVISIGNAPVWMLQEPVKDMSKIVLGNGLVPSGSKPLLETMLTKFYIAIISRHVGQAMAWCCQATRIHFGHYLWRHMASLGSVSWIILALKYS